MQPRRPLTVTAAVTAAVLLLPVAAAAAGGARKHVEGSVEITTVDAEQVGDNRIASRSYRRLSTQEQRALETDATTTSTGTATGSTSTTAITATPVPATGRLGLHVTATELAVWRTRAAAGPYRTAGDAGTNSPGDWTRVSTNAATFHGSPDAAVWAGPVDNNPGGCVTGEASTRFDPPASARVLLRDAAFTALVQADVAAAGRVADGLLAQAREPGVRFADRARWCLGKRIDDLNPGFEIAGWMTSLVFAYDYVRITDPTAFSAAEQRELLDWFAGAAEWMTADVDDALERNFTDRLQRSGAPYTLSSHRASNPSISDEPYAGAGPRIGAIARYYNNRRAGMMRFVGVAGQALADAGHAGPSSVRGYTAATYRERAARFVQDWLVYSVYADGFVGDFERTSSSLPDLGWAYGMQALSPVLTIADTFARAGDDTLYRFTTAAGAHGSEGAPAGEAGKSLRWISRTMTGYVDGSIERYAPGHAGDPTYRIDGVHAPSDWNGLHDLALVPANATWRDAAISRVTTRALPSRVAGPGAHSPFGGDWGVYPAVLLMFG
ncbi:MAG: hypothetical protein ACLGIR_10560 [Actinomycetes bacterium]